MTEELKRSISLPSESEPSGNAFLGRKAWVTDRWCFRTIKRTVLPAEFAIMCELIALLLGFKFVIHIR